MLRFSGTEVFTYDCETTKEKSFKFELKYLFIYLPSVVRIKKSYKLDWDEVMRAIGEDDITSLYDVPLLLF